MNKDDDDEYWLKRWILTEKMNIDWKDEYWLIKHNFSCEVISKKTDEHSIDNFLKMVMKLKAIYEGQPY